MIVFGAISATSDANKGFLELTLALEHLKTQNVELIVFGSGYSSEISNLPQNVHFIGKLTDDVALKLLYSAADVMVVPSKQESFGQTATEAMACGTPVVAFKTTGLIDIVDHKENGYLALPFDEKDLAEGLDWVLNYNNYKLLSDNARKKIVSKYDYKVVAPMYISLYESLLRNKRLYL